MTAQSNWGARRLALRLGIGAVAGAFVTVGAARADSDNVMKIAQVNLEPNLVTCGGAPFVPTSFSFDISWIDPFLRVFLLADRSHGGAANGSVTVIHANDPSTGATFITPPANDPFAGIRCDANAAFGGTTGAGRNEITGPNGVFTVNHVEAWVGDAPSFSGPIGQTNSATDYAFDNCDSNVRVFNLITRQQTDHINLGGCFRTDEGAFDPDDQIALFANPSERNIGHGAFAHPFISLISTIPVAPGQHHKILKQIPFDGTRGTVNAEGGIEQAVYSHKTGLFYIAVPGNSAAPNVGFVAVVDPRGDDSGDIRVVANIRLSKCSPNGAALGPDFKLFLGCSAGPEQVIDIRSGHVLKVVA